MTDKTETQTDADSAPAPDDYKGRLHGAIRALAEARATIGRLRREAAACQAQVQAPPPAAAPAQDSATMEIPDVEADPISAIKAIRELAIQVQQERKAENDAEQRANYVKGLGQQFMQAEQAFAAAQPDYHDGGRHYLQQRANELQALGLGKVEVREALARDILNMTEASLKRGRNPAEVMYLLGRQRGYQGQSPGALDAVAAGQAAARTISGAGARASVTDGSPEARLAGLSGAALREAWKRIKAERAGA